MYIRVCYVDVSSRVNVLYCSVTIEADETDMLTLSEV